MFKIHRTALAVTMVGAFLLGFAGTQAQPAAEAADSKVLNCAIAWEWCDPA
ncbi:hypothetical protein [Salininema proteolyticum]|uniref:ABC transporter substrate-binding protein n=1 Tax=Salininema proteolyticum TaxID=1607685 RepID=A0ABV8TZU8_9ACTN